MATEMLKKLISSVEGSVSAVADARAHPAVPIVKKLINSVDSCVSDAVEGAVLSDSRIKRVEGLNIIVRGDIEEIKANYVSIISGTARFHAVAQLAVIMKLLYVRWRFWARTSTCRIRWWWHAFRRCVRQRLRVPLCFHDLICDTRSRRA
jgi:hypothetical protein